MGQARTAGEDLGHWPEIRDLLNRHCGYDLAKDEVLLLDLFGSLWYIRDIGLRMLTPRELYNGMGFPPDYIIDRDCMGNEYGKTKQVARCGNAVCPQWRLPLSGRTVPTGAARTSTPWQIWKRLSLFNKPNTQNRRNKK